MFNLFNKPNPSISDIEIPSFDWNLTQDTAELKQWINADQTMAVSINFFNLKPDLPPLNEIKVVRDYYRKQLEHANGGLLQTDLIEINGFKVIKTLFKIQPDDASLTYLSSLTIPFDSHSYVIKIQAPEYGVTGIRTSVIADRLLKEKVILPSETGYEGWNIDPYDVTLKRANLMNLSENSEHDDEFPSHPLSMSRKLMTQIESELHFNDVLRQLKPYT
ncbi:MAG: hypothetical protein Crog4KO_17440 [Crocinitomicaceae bacterium]